MIDRAVGLAIGWWVEMQTTIHLPYTHSCFVCGADNPAGLRLRFRFEHGEMRADFTPRVEHAGYKGMVHGGIVATALDEAMFWAAAYATRQFQVSVEMNVRWSRKVEAGRRYLIGARHDREQRKFCFTEAELRAADGQVCARATGKYFPMRPEDVPLALEDFFSDPATMSPQEFLPRGHTVDR